MSARPDRKAVSDRPAATGRRSSDRRATDRRTPGATGGTNPSRRRDRAAAGTTDSAAPADGLVLGPVPLAARVAGGLLLLSALLAGVGAFPTYLVIGGKTLAQVTGPASALVALLVPVASAAVGVLLVRRAVPKFGLAYAGVTGALALGQLLIEIYRGSSSTARPGVEVVAGTRVLTSSVHLGAGWILGVAALGLAVLAGVVAAVAWGRTVMEDGGTLDPVRGALAGAAVLLGVGAVLCLSLPAADVPDRLVTDPATGMQTVVTREGPQALLERPGLALLGGLLLAGAVVLCSVIAPSLRPRLAAVGGLLALTVTLLAAGFGGLRDAVHSDELDWTLPGAGLLVAAFGYALLTVLAWRLRRARTGPEQP